jgi:hypothetical protein
VADNIRFGRPEATRAEVEAAARAIGADPVILALPHGYDTEVGERCALLSAGERQLVAFARAWIADPAVLILDEATSSLDVATETRVTEAMRRLRQGRTTIVIAHRLSTVIEADRIAVIEDGRVVELGSPDELRAHGGAAEVVVVDEGLEGALVVAVGELGVGGVEGVGGLNLGHGQDLVGGDVADLGLGVDEPLDQPGAGDPVGLGTLAGDPLHAGPPVIAAVSVGSWTGRNRCHRARS